MSLLEVIQKLVDMDLWVLKVVDSFLTNLIIQCELFDFYCCYTVEIHECHYICLQRTSFNYCMLTLSLTCFGTDFEVTDHRGRKIQDEELIGNMRKVHQDLREFYIFILQYCFYIIFLEVTQLFG